MGGYECSLRLCCPADIYGINTAYGTGNPWDDQGHGTHCAGTLAAKGRTAICSSDLFWGAVNTVQRDFASAIPNSFACMVIAGNNSEGVIGVAGPGSNVKIMSCKFISFVGTGSLSAALECLECGP